ncbi:hypothetical protein C5S39_01475 [Candidatus Methanophagaceae archaeon]|nr:hypothetical protein C5S39_01475 [Methanophagales archaeon]
MRRSSSIRRTYSSRYARVSQVRRDYTFTTYRLIGYLYRCKQLIWTGRLVVHVDNRYLSRLDNSLPVAAMASEATDVT